MDKQQRELIELYSIFIFQKKSAGGGAVPQQQKPARKEGGKMDGGQ